MAAQFRSYVWDPALIVAQMVLLQAGYYSSLGLWLALLGALGSTRPSLHQVFSDEVRRGGVETGRGRAGAAPLGKPSSVWGSRAWGCFVGAPRVNPEAAGALGGIRSLRGTPRAGSPPHSVL